MFEKGQSYVALSRAATMEGLQVLRFDPKKVRPSKQLPAQFAFHYRSLTHTPARDRFFFLLVGLCAPQSHRMEQVPRKSHDVMGGFYDTITTVSCQGSTHGRTNVYL